MVSGKLGSSVYVGIFKVISENKYPGSVHRHRAKAGSFCCFEGIFFSGNYLKNERRLSIKWI